MMTFSENSTGSSQHPAARVLAVVSHKGGTGRTTAALGIAWALGQAGWRTRVADAEPTRCAALIAAGHDGVCRWPNVTLTAGWPPPDTLDAPDITVVDCPGLTEPEALDVLREADAVIVSVLADTMCLRTLPVATSVLREARAENPSLRVLGLLIGAYDANDVNQSRLLARMRDGNFPLLLDPCVPRSRSLREWALKPGSDVPPGSGRQAFEALADKVVAGLGLEKAEYATAGRD